MKALDTGEIVLTAEEAKQVAYFIDYTLDRAWDRYTDNVIVGAVTWEDGKRRMDPEMYDLGKQIEQL